MRPAVTRRGVRLLAAYDEGPGLAAHRARFGPLPDVDLARLRAAAHAWGIRGCGGAGFPFATKLEAVAAGRRRVVVVNLSEGEPASHKDAALALGRPHLVLDGAVAVARALRVREVHLVVPGERPEVVQAIRTAVAERGERMRFTLHQADPGFVAGQARAVLELMAGRPNLPVTAWQPEVFDGHRGRPTLLSNAETWAQVAVRLLPGSASGPSTMLLTWDGERSPLVTEAEEGTPWRDLVAPGAGPMLVGGYHGTWVRRQQLDRLHLDRAEMAAAGVPLGAGAVVPLGVGECPVTMTARITAYLASQSARRCGPCLNGLPALALAVSALVDGSGTVERVDRLRRSVTGRGACAHPDGTARLVASLVRTFPEELDAHGRGGCATERSVVGEMVR